MQKFEVTTRESGAFFTSVKLEILETVAKEGTLTLRLAAPALTEVQCVIDVEPGKGSSRNHAREVVLKQGEPAVVEGWQITDGEMSLKLIGLTKPGLESGKLEFEVQLKPAETAAKATAGAGNQSIAMAASAFRHQK